LVPPHHALQHLKQVAGGQSVDDPTLLAAKAVIVEEVERLHWRLWNGKTNDAQISIDRIRAVTHHFRGEHGHWKSIASSQKLCTALHAFDGYLTSQCDRSVHYQAAPCRIARWYRDHQETANFLMNRRMNKSQQMRRSRRGADLLRQVRCAVYNRSPISDSDRNSTQSMIDTRKRRSLPDPKTCDGPPSVQGPSRALRKQPSDPTCKANRGVDPLVDKEAEIMCLN
jgi:hypothetical protein